MCLHGGLQVMLLTDDGVVVCGTVCLSVVHVICVYYH
jgi:hypothetical protein